LIFIKNGHSQGGKMADTILNLEKLLENFSPKDFPIFFKLAISHFSRVFQVLFNVKINNERQVAFFPRKKNEGKI